MENETVTVGTLFICDKLQEYDQARTYDPLWTQTVVGCKIIELLQDMYRFNITYVMQKTESNLTNIGDPRSLYPANDEAIDIYTRPMSLPSDFMGHSCPVATIYKWRFGFVLRRPDDNNYLQMFYSKPFTRPLWNCLYAMAVIISIFFFLLQLWEKRVLGRLQEDGITYEMLMVVGSYCQHIPPLHAVLTSRRTAYFVFLMFSSVTYSFYTSNLLSHLVNDKTEKMSLESLAKSDYSIDIMENAKLLLELGTIKNHRNIHILEEKLLKINYVSVEDGLRRVKTGKTALLTDYTSLYPYLKRIFEIEEYCGLTDIDLFTNVNKYLITSKKFPHKEHFKIGTLRTKESGVLQRLMHKHPNLCDSLESTKNLQTQIIQIFVPLCTLLCSYALAVLILIGERLYYKRYRLFPYVN